jgi:hypothetical protein
LWFDPLARLGAPVIDFEAMVIADGETELKNSIFDCDAAVRNGLADFSVPIGPA